MAVSSPGHLTVVPYPQWKLGLHPPQVGSPLPSPQTRVVSVLTLEHLVSHAQCSFQEWWVARWQSTTAPEQLSRCVCVRARVCE